MQMRNVRDLFLHELSDIYDGEKTIAQMLPKMAGEVTSDQVKSGIQQHERETQQQIKNLEQCFQILGTQPDKVTCHAVLGLEQEHETFMKDNPPKDLLTMFDLGAAAKTEHYEIASYRGLVDKAGLMGQQECARLLHENLQQEEAMVQRVEQIGHQLGQQMMQQMGTSGQART